MSKIMEPIFIIGAARSGTKMLGNIFNMHPEVSYKGESNYIWRLENSNFKNDLLPVSVATKEVKNKIWEKFYSNIEKDKVLVEKTAANSLRLPFVLEIFSNAKLIHIVRDGRDVALSARKKWRGEFSDFEKEKLGKENEKKSIILRIWQRIISGDIAVTELHNYFFKGINILKTHLGMSDSGIWGPRFPGIDELYKTHSLIEVCAFQWLNSVQSILNFHANNQDIPYYLVKYEELTASPAEKIDEIFSFCELDRTDNWSQIVASIKKGNSFKWKEQLTEREIYKVQNITAKILDLLDYKLYNTKFGDRDG